MIKTGFFKIKGGHHAPGIHKIIERAGAEFGNAVIAHQGRGCGNQSKDILTGAFQGSRVCHPCFAGAFDGDVLNVL